MELLKTAQWQDFVKFDDERPNPQTLTETERVRVIVAGLKAGQRIPLHPEAAAVYTILEGSGEMNVDDKTYAVQAGSVILVGNGALRGMLAESQLVFMAVRLA